MTCRDGPRAGVFTATDAAARQGRRAFPGDDPLTAAVVLAKAAGRTLPVGQDSFELGLLFMS
jgi:hypothetical protein